jgi:hypothetical protein
MEELRKVTKSLKPEQRSLSVVLQTDYGIEDRASIDCCVLSRRSQTCSKVSAKLLYMVPSSEMKAAGTRN